MNVSNAVLTRKTVRSFDSKPVPHDLIEELLSLASHAPSNGNLQPWRVYVVTGDTLDSLKLSAKNRLDKDGFEMPEYEVYPSPLPEPYRTHRFEVGELLYKTIGIDREDKVGRLSQFSKNAELFGAPLGIFFYVDRRLGPGQWLDVGHYLQSLLLLLEERGLGSCVQGYWSFLHQVVADHICPPDELMLICGLAVGYESKDAPINRVKASRQQVNDFVTWIK